MPAAWSPGIRKSNEISWDGIFAEHGRLTNPVRDAMTYHMTRATVRDLRYRFSKVEDLLQEGEEIQITKRGRPVALLIPVRAQGPAKRPDFLARLKRIYGDKILAVSGAELLAEERGRY